MNGELDRGLERKVFIGFLLTLALVLFTGFYFLTESRRQAAADRRFLERSQRWGAEMFLLNCAECHGQRGEGLVGPALRDSQLDEKSLVLVTSRGKPGTAMPAFAKEEGGVLTSYQVHDLARFIRHWSDDALEEARRRHEEEQARLATPTPAPTPSPSPGATPTPTPSPQPTPTLAPGASPTLTPPPSPTPGPTPAISPSPPADIERGKALFRGQGCAVCHTLAGISSSPVGPDLSKIGSVAATRQPGVSAADYLRESLLNPGAFVVPGFTAPMPSYQGRLSAEELKALMDFLLSLK